jgi:hypothetical protein
MHRIWLDMALMPPTQRSIVATKAAIAMAASAVANPPSPARGWY